jgi:hypothetical protein
LAADSAIEQILQKVEQILRAIPGIAVVSRDGVDALEIQSFPACVIGTGASEPDQLLNDFIDWSLFLNISCWVSAQSNISKALEAFKAQVAAAMAADSHIGLADKCWTEEGAWSGPFPLNEALTEAAEIKNYTVHYRTLRTDPYTLVG